MIDLYKGDCLEVMDELIAKINEVDWNKVKEESNIGSRFDFSV